MKYVITGFMSGRGDWRGNACRETLLGLLKVERFLRQRVVTWRHARK